jgi:hypothetical protein
MDEKIKEVKSHIIEEIPGSRIQYQHAGGLHKLRIEGDTPTHWLYLSDEIVDDSNGIELTNLIIKNHVIKTFNKAGNSKWLFLCHGGLQEVDQNFAK